MMPLKQNVGIIGATSIIGDYLLPLLAEKGYGVVAFTRQREKSENNENSAVAWQLLKKFTSSEQRPADKEEKIIDFWISLAPAPVLSRYFPMLLSYGVKHIVAVSSTSRFTKENSTDPEEKKLAKDLVLSEEHLMSWAKKEKIAFTILRPTLIYSPGRDKNISVIASFIRRFSFFCILGEADGLRQPVHAEDVAFACAAALSERSAMNRSYNISGGEILTYRDMVRRVFSALGKEPKFVKIPLWLFSFAIFILRIFPRFRQWSTAMAQRMNKDMVFDHTDANRDLNFSPRKFNFTKEDLSFR